MSTLSQFIGSGWNLVASGSTSVNSGSTVDVTISTTKYSTDQAYVYSTFRSGVGSYWPDYPNNQPTTYTGVSGTAYLTSNTNVRVHGGSSYRSTTNPGGSAVVVDWYVFEQGV